MSEFSEYLDSYMNEIAISSAELSEELGIERTTVYRYRKGSRIPVNDKMVVQMADALQMSVPERAEFIEKYDYLNIGEMVVNSYQYVCSLLKRMKNAEEEKTAFAFCETVSLSQFKKTISAMDTEDEIVAVISALFEDIKQGDGQSLMLVMQPVYETVQKMIQVIFRESGVQIEQIVCLEQRLGKNYKNLEVLQWILPLCFDNVDYNVRYYYDFLSHHINGMSWIPNIIISEKRVVMFDYEMQHGVLIQDPEVVRLMKKKYDEIRKNTSSLVVGVSGAIKVVDVYDGSGNIVIAAEPCVGVGISSDIYEEFLYPFPEKKEFIQLMAQWNGDWADMVFHEPGGIMGTGILSLCRLEKIRSFMETGRVREFPAGFYRPLDMDIRKKVLRRCIHLIKNGRIKYYILPDEVDVPGNIFCYVGEGNKITLNRMCEDGITKLEICEQSIHKAFKNFIEYMEKKGMLPDQGEVVRRLEEIVEEY